MAHTERGYEERDVNVRVILRAGLLLIGVTLATLAIVWVQFRVLAERTGRRDAPPSPVVSARPEQPPEPRLQTTPVADLKQLRAAEDALLGSYGWVDPEAGVVRVPLGRAQELLLQEAGR